MENIVTSLKIRCVKVGTNLSKVCEAAGVDRDTITRWEKEEPLSFKILRKLDGALAKLEANQKEVSE